MKLTNDFSEEDKAYVWTYHEYCCICSSNIGCSLHHIYGRKGLFNNSILNSVMLCHKHHKIADGRNIHETGDEFRIKLLSMSLRQVTVSGYIFKIRDKNFIKDIYKDVEKILGK